MDSPPCSPGRLKQWGGTQSPVNDVTVLFRLEWVPQTEPLPAHLRELHLPTGCTLASHPHQPTCLAPSTPQSTKPAPPGGKWDTSIRPLTPHAALLASGPGQVMESLSPGITQHEGGGLGCWRCFGPSCKAPGRGLPHNRCSYRPVFCSGGSSACWRSVWALELDAKVQIPPQLLSSFMTLGHLPCSQAALL